MTALTESEITRRAFIYAAEKVNDSHWRKGWDYLACGELCEFGFARGTALACVAVKLRSHPHQQVKTISLRSLLAEGAGFARILLDLTASFAPLNRVIKHYQHVFGT